jgi:hypothetical protein
VANGFSLVNDRLEASTTVGIFAVGHVVSKGEHSVGFYHTHLQVAGPVTLSQDWYIGADFGEKIADYAQLHHTDLHSSSYLWSCG